VPIPFILSAAARVTLTVWRGNKVVATLSTTRREAGRGELTWNGRIKRTLATAGVYKLIVRAVSPAGGLARDAATVSISS
jgi:hypothetical protein